MLYASISIHDVEDVETEASVYTDFVAVSIRAKTRDGEEQGTNDLTLYFKPSTLGVETVEEVVAHVSTLFPLIKVREHRTVTL